jgi:hypothetical protein
MVSVIEQIVKFTAVDFIKTCNETQVLLLLEQLHDVVGSHEVEAGDTAVLRAHHGPCFSTACLPVSETSSVTSLK